MKTLSILVLALTGAAVVSFLAGAAAIGALCIGAGVVAIAVGDYATDLEARAAALAAVPAAESADSRYPFAA